MAPNVFERNVHCLLGLPFDAVDMASAVSRIRDALTRRESCLLSTPNLNWIVASTTDNAFRDSVIDSDLSIVDGMPLVWVAKLLDVPIRERIAGSSMFENLRQQSQDHFSVYFFGGAEGLAEAACRQLNSSSSALVCVGYDSAGFGSAEELSSEKTIARINASGADFVVVSLGARKGQAWITRNRDRLAAPVISHLGAVMHFVAGIVRRAPPWAQRSGLEWLWRIKEEPRLWRRYFGDGVAFFRLLVTRVVPYWWLLRRHKPAGTELDEPEVELLDHDGGVEIHLRGAWMLENLLPLREYFSRRVLAGKDVRLEMEHVTYVDSAFLGLLMLLYIDRKRRGKRLSIGSLKECVRRIFHYACAEFLLDTR
jgi:N-acetylglucosaminyldiphosphoundecaprenol N-acetyl-beta-D-mannosaminyltransferase